MVFSVSILGSSTSFPEIAFSNLGTISAQEISCSWGSGVLRCVHHTSFKKSPTPAASWLNSPESIRKGHCLTTEAFRHAHSFMT